MSLHTCSHPTAIPAPTCSSLRYPALTESQTKSSQGSQRLCTTRRSGYSIAWLGLTSLSPKRAGILKAARDQHSPCCVAAAVQDAGCGIKLPPPPRVVIDGTKYQRTHRAACRLCDSIVFWIPTGEATATTFAVAIELKGGKV